MIEKSILLILANKDFNEDEYLVVKTILEQESFKLFIASDAHSLCVGSKGLKVRPDISFYNMRESNFSAVVIIGGGGTRNYWGNPQIHNLLNNFNRSNKLIAAICSAPVILARAGLLNEKEATCYLNDKKELERDGAVFVNIPVKFQKNIITAQNASASQQFAQTIAERLK